MDPRTLLPDLTPEQRDEWLRSFGPKPNGPPPPPPEPAPMPPGEAAAYAAMNGAPPPPKQALPPIAYAPPAAPAGAVAQRLAATTAKVEAEQRAKNIAGASFYEPAQGTAAPQALAVLPGGWMPHEEKVTRQEGIPIGQETKRQYEKAEGEQREAAQLGADAGIERANAEAAYLNTFAQRQQEHADSLAAQAAKRQQRMDAETAKLARIRDRIVNADVDPIEDYWNERGFASRFTAAIGVALGAFAASLNHTQNYALEALNSSIANNIAAQKARQANALGKLDAQRTFLGDLQKEFGNEDMAENAAWMAYLQKAKTEMAAQAEQSKVPEIRARYASAIADVDKEMGDRRRSWEVAADGKVVRESSELYHPPRVIGGPATGKKAEELNSHVHQLAKDYEEAKIPTSLAELEDIDRSLDAFGTGPVAGYGRVGIGPLSISKESLPGTLLSDEGVANRQAIAVIKNKIRNKIAGASLTEKEKEELDKQLEGSGDVPSMRRVVQSFRQDLSNQQRNLEAGAPPEAVREYRQRGGPVQTVRPNEKTAPTVKREE